MAQISGLNFKIQEMAHRIRELREIEGYTIAEMAMKTGVTEQEYIDCEAGRSDLNFAFIYRCALAFNVDVTDIIQGSSPKLSSFTVTRRGAGQKIEEAHGMVYYNLAAPFQNRISEPLYVKCDYSVEAERRDIELTTHEGQECDIVIRGHMRIQIGGHTEVTDAVNRVLISATVIGKARRLVSAAEGQVGDALIMTGEAAREGTAILAQDKPERLDPETVREAKQLSAQLSVLSLQALSMQRLHSAVLWVLPLPRL